MLLRSRCARVLLLAACALLVSGPAPAAGARCHGKPDPHAQPNEFPVEVPRLRPLGHAANGALFAVGDDDSVLRLLHVWGKPYDMGFAQCALQPDRCRSFFNATYAYLVEQVEDAAKAVKLPKWFVEAVAKLGLEAALEAQWLVMESHVPKHFLDEMRGVADGAKLPLRTVLQLHMIGELTKAQCSMFGAWGSATPDGHLLQMRALDWDVAPPFTDHPQITVYHPEGGAASQHAFANIGFTGFVGAMTGLSAASTAISEIGVSFPDSTFGDESRFGVPFVFLLRDLLQFDANLTQMQRRISDAERTCHLMLGLGDGKAVAPGAAGGARGSATPDASSAPFSGVRYAHSAVSFFTDPANVPPTEEWHPPLEDVIYWGMDWACPGYSVPLHHQLAAHHGNLTAEAAARDVAAVTQTGDLHIALYHLEPTPGQGKLLVSFARPTTSSAGPLKAFDRPYLDFDLAELFAKPTQAASGAAENAGASVELSASGDKRAAKGGVATE